MKLNDFTKLFFAIVLAHIVASLVNEDRWLILATKPMIMGAIIAYFIGHTSAYPNPFRKNFTLGFIFSLIGDIFLMLQGEQWFLAGLGSFLVAQVFFISGFFRSVNLRSGFLAKRPLWILLPLAYAVSLLTWLWPGLDDMRIPVILYSIVLVGMLISALNRRGVADPSSYVWGTTGALFFVASDSLLAINLFGDFPLPYSSLWIMGTYATAQYSLMVSALPKMEKVDQ